jgi:hypothetical protein
MICFAKGLCIVWVNFGEKSMKRKNNVAIGLDGEMVRTVSNILDSENFPDGSILRVPYVLTDYVDALHEERRVEFVKVLLSSNGLLGVLLSGITQEEKEDYFKHFIGWEERMSKFFRTCVEMEYSFEFAAKEMCVLMYNGTVIRDRAAIIGTTLASIACPYGSLRDRVIVAHEKCFSGVIGSLLSLPAGGFVVSVRSLSVGDGETDG